MNSKALTAIVMVYVGCGLNNVFLEYLVKQDPGAGHMITFLQFVFIAFHGIIFTWKFGKVKPKIGMSDYTILVTMFFITSVVNNWAFNFHIPVPLHMIFRSGSLIANMIMGIWLKNNTYRWSKYLSVGMITLGIIICTLLSTGKSKVCTDCGMDPSLNATTTDSEGLEYLFWWIIGIILLTSALLLSARMGIYQEYLTERYGKNPEEALFYTHLFSLPGFIFYANNIKEHAAIASNSSPVLIPLLNFVIPLVWIYLIMNVLTQYLCIKSVYILTSEVSSLTLTLVLTLRKFFSLMFSIVYFQNPFTFGHWIGTLLVFSGTLIFTEVPQKLQIAYAPKGVKEKMS